MSVTVQNDIQSLLKINYRDLFVDSLFQDTVLFDLIPKYSGDVRGQSFNHAVELTRSHGGGARNAGEFLPVDYPETFTQSQVNLARWYWTISIDGFAIEMFKKGDGSFVDYLDLRMRNAQRDASNELNRICHMDGTGVLARLTTGTTAVTAGSNITVTHPWGYSFGGPQFFEEGDSVVLMDPANTANTLTARITAVDWTNNAIQIDKNLPATFPADSIFVSGDDFGNSYTKEATGLRGIIADGTTTDQVGNTITTVQNIPCTTNRRWRSSIVDTTAAPVAYDWTHITRLVAAAQYKGSTKPGNLVLLMHPAMLEEHQRLVDPDIRYEATAGTFSKNLMTPTFNVLGQQVPVRTTTRCGFQEVICINTSELERIELRPMDWDDTDGATLKQLQGKDAAYAYMRYYWGVAARSLNHFSKHDGIQVDSTFVRMISETA